MLLLNIAIFEKILAFAWIVFIKVNTLLGKACFLKLMIDIPLVSNLSKIPTSFLHLQAKLKNLLSLLLKLILKN